LYRSGDGDLHDTRFSEHGRAVILAGTALSGASSMQHHYHLTLYPTEDFFEVYSTDNPMVATLGAVLIVVVTSLLFFLYDYVVRREFSAKQHLLQAKRKFMRFVSHEVRTPLNAVCMGLILLQEELEKINGKCQSSEGCSEESNVEFADATKKERDLIGMSLNGWLTLTEEIRSSAKSSVAVLDDLLNYDKIEMGTLSLELTVFSFWRIVTETSSEFRLSAKQKMIKFELDFSPLIGEKLGETLESFDDTLLSQQMQQRLVVGDRIRITQVLRNLVSNALKFTPEGGKLFFWSPAANYFVDGNPHRFTICYRYCDRSDVMGTVETD
jgi:signal transduction histidine kinase